MWRNDYPNPTPCGGTTTRVLRHVEERLPGSYSMWRNDYPDPTPCGGTTTRILLHVEERLPGSYPMWWSDYTRILLHMWRNDYCRQQEYAQAPAKLLCAGRYGCPTLECIPESSQDRSLGRGLPPLVVHVPTVLVGGRVLR